MTIPKEAIDKAIKGGYRDPITGSEVEGAWEIIALDPTFWQALDKETGPHISSERILTTNEIAHRFYDLILTGGDTEKFWQELLDEKAP